MSKTLRCPVDGCLSWFDVGHDERTQRLAEFDLRQHLRIVHPDWLEAEDE